jgi:hypothetical protein
MLPNEENYFILYTTFLLIAKFFPRMQNKIPPTSQSTHREEQRGIAIMKSALYLRL